MMEHRGRAEESQSTPELVPPWVPSADEEPPVLDRTEPQGMVDYLTIEMDVRDFRTCVTDPKTPANTAAQMGGRGQECGEESVEGIDRVTADKRFDIPDELELENPVMPEYLLIELEEPPSDDLP